MSGDVIQFFGFIMGPGDNFSFTYDDGSYRDFGSVRSEKFTIQQLLPGKVKDFSRITARKAGLLYQSFEYDIEWIVIKIFG